MSRSVEQELIDALKNCLAFIESAAIEEGNWKLDPVGTAKAAIARMEAHINERCHTVSVPSDWPRDPANGRLLCSPERPMPKGAQGRWAHTRVETVSSDSDFSLGTEYDRKRCKDCGTEWTAEVPQ